MCETWKIQSLCPTPLKEIKCGKFEMFFLIHGTGFPVAVFLALSILTTDSNAVPTLGRCGKYMPRDPRIVGGKDAIVGSYNWIVSIKGSMGHFCGGFVISDRHVLSAAHCFLKDSNEQLDYSDGKVVLSSMKVTLGEFYLKSSETPFNAITVGVESILVHPNYNARTKENDIAIIRLDKDVTVHPDVQPVCLPDSDAEKEYSGKKATIAGWGRLYFNENYYDWQKASNTMKEAEITIWNSEDCVKTYKGFNFPSKSFICAGDKGKDSCQGDSGGPLMLLKQNKWTAIGVVSVGKACGAGGHPGVYTDVSSFLEWIHFNTK